MFQTVFLLMDHLSTWIRMVRQHMIKKRSDAKKTRATSLNSGDELEDQLMQVDSLITSIDRDLMSTAAFNCRSYARALMTLEQLIASRKEVQATEAGLQLYYERLHLIYSHLDEPDGMEGVSTKVLAPSLEHQIREHESTGRWTSAQSCWELKLQQSPHDVDLHIGLLRCLRNLGHYGTS
jgi:serine/threonine-protein kinase ATR